jgi:N-acetyl sugar amidotransferase
MDTTDPDIEFDEEGFCNHCIEAEARLKREWFPGEEGSRKLKEIVESVREENRHREYDCIIGLSGGVDSSYLAYRLRRDFPDLRILAVHVDAGWNSELAVHNIETIVKSLDIDLYTRVMDWGEMQDLQLAYFKSQLANQDVPQDHAFNATLIRTALEHGLRYFFSGSNLTSESILPFAWGYDAMDARQLLAVHRRFGKRPLKDFETVSFFRRRIYLPHIRKFRTIKPLNHMPYHKDESKKILEKELGWRDYGGKHHESRFTKFFQSYWLPEKFGYDKRKAHLSSMIVAGQIGREEALEELKKPPYDENELAEDKEFLAKKLGISLDEFEDIMAQPNKSFRDYPSYYEMERLLRSVLERVRPLLGK